MEDNLQVINYNQTSQTTQSSPPKNRWATTALILIGSTTIVLIAGILWILNRNTSINTPTQDLPTNQTSQVSPTVPAVTDYKSIFSITIPEGHTEIQDFYSNIHGRPILVIKTPEQLHLKDPYIVFHLVPKDPKTALEDLAYDSERCVNDKQDSTCSGYNNPPYVNKLITVDGRKALWLQVDNLPLGDRLAVFIEKSPTEVITVTSFTQDASSLTTESDVRIIPIMEEILSSVHFVE